MKRPTRTLLFLLFALFFVVVTPVVLGYSQGYRIDWRKKIIVQTGALFLAPRPAPVTLALDGKVKEISNVVFQNVFVGNLIPKSYLIQVSKTNYHTWEKNLPVSAKLVSEARNILLVPKNSSPQEIAKNVRNFSPSPSGKYLLTVQASELPEIYVYHTRSAKSELLLKGSEKFRNYIISNIQWDKDSTRVLFALEEQKNPSSQIAKEVKKHWILIDVEGGAPFEILDITGELTTLKVRGDNFQWDPDRPAELLFQERNVLFSYNSENKKISEPLLNDVLAYSSRENKIAYITSSPQHVQMLDRASRVTEQLSFNTPLSLHKNSQIFFPQTAELTLLLDEDVYIWSEKSNALIKIADQIKKASPAPDGKKLLLLSKIGIQVYWFRDVHIQPFRDRGDLETIVETDGEVLDAVWLASTNEHIIFANKNAVYITELDGRDKRNTHELIQKSAQSLFYEEESRVLYFLSQGSVYLVSIK